MKATYGDEHALTLYTFIVYIDAFILYIYRCKCVCFKYLCILTSEWIFDIHKCNVFFSLISAIPQLGYLDRPVDEQERYIAAAFLTGTRTHMRMCMHYMHVLVHHILLCIICNYIWSLYSYQYKYVFHVYVLYMHMCVHVDIVNMIGTTLNALLRSTSLDPLHTSTKISLHE